MKNRLWNRNNRRLINSKMFVIRQKLNLPFFKHEDLKKIAVSVGFYGIPNPREHLIQRDDVDDFAYELDVIFTKNSVVINLLRHFLKLQKIRNMKMVFPENSFSA